MAIGTREVILWTGAETIAVTDTDDHLSDSSTMAMTPDSITFQAISTLNQAGTLTWQGSSDNTNWTDLPNPEAISASSTAVATLSDPWAYIRVKFTAAVSPASGVLQVTAMKKVMR